MTLVCNRVLGSLSAIFAGGLKVWLIMILFANLSSLFVFMLMS